MSSEFQDSIELALADQLPFSFESKALYNSIKSSLDKRVLDTVLALQSSRKSDMEISDVDEVAADAEDVGGAEAVTEDVPTYSEAEIARGIRYPLEADSSLIRVNMGSYYLMNDHICSPMRTAAGLEDFFNARAENFNAAIEKNPDHEYYCYYIETEVDADFNTGARSQIYETLFPMLNVSQENKAAFMFNSFAEFEDYFFKTDHHWRYLGSYKAYKDLLKIILPQEEALEPISSCDVAEFHGSRASGSLSEYSEEFIAYEFNFAEDITCKINGAAADYGGQEAYIASANSGNEIADLTYGKFYGPDSGEIIFTNSSCDNGSILLIGESYDNALLRLLSNHFSELYSIDIRNYKAHMGKDFVFSDYLSNHDIDRVLFIGASDYWIWNGFYIY